MATHMENSYLMDNSAGKRILIHPKPPDSRGSTTARGKTTFSQSDKSRPIGRSPWLCRPILRRRNGRTAPEKPDFGKEKHRLPFLGRTLFIVRILASNAAKNTHLTVF